MAVGILSSAISVVGAVDALGVPVLTPTIWIVVYSVLSALSIVVVVLWSRTRWRRWPYIDMLIKSSSSINFFMFVLLVLDVIIARTSRDEHILPVCLYIALLPSAAIALNNEWLV